MTKHYQFTKYRFSGTAAELVTEMHKASRAKCHTDAEWMRETAARIDMASSQKVRSENAEHFVDDLIAANLINAFLED